MDKKISFLLISGSAVMSFVYSFTSPIIQIYFVSRVDSNILALANLISITLAAGVNTTIPHERAKMLYRKYFNWIVIIDVICFIIISITSADEQHIYIRFLGLSILSAVSSTIWGLMLRDSINQVINGDKLTNWSSKQNSIALWAALGGSIIAVIFTSLSIMVCIGLQCVANIISGFTDIYAFKELRKSKESGENG